jgi:hypothetical protein
LFQVCDVYQCGHPIFFLALYREAGESKMTALVHALSHAFQTNAEIDSLKIVAIFSGLGLLVSLLCVLFLLTYGLDLSPGFL